MKRTAFAVAIVFAFELTFGSAAWPLERSICKPSWISLSNKPIVARAGAYQIEFTAILIGCKDKLQGLGENKIGGAREALKAFLSERSLRLIGGADSVELRSAAVAAINKSIKSDCVTDVYFSSLAVGESM